MGFNLGAFGAGVLGGVADTVTKQRKDIDSRIDKYLDFGVQRGTKILDERVAENKVMVGIGNQLKQRNLSHDQVKLVLEGGLESAQEFLASVKKQESYLPADQTYDAGQHVTPTGKSNGQTWEEYLNNSIYGTADTSDVFSNTGVAPVGGSILDTMLGNTTPQSVSSSSVRNRAGMAQGMGYSVEDALAASRNSFTRDRSEDVVAQGMVRLAADPVGQQDLLNKKRAYDYQDLQITQINAAIATAILDEAVKIPERELALLVSKQKKQVVKYQIDNKLGIEDIQLKHDKMKNDARGLGNFESASIYFAMTLRDELSKPEEERDQQYIDNLEQDLMAVQAASAFYFDGKSTTTNPFTHTMLTKFYKASLNRRMIATFGSKNSDKGILVQNSIGDWQLNNNATAAHYDRVIKVHADAADDWLSVATANGATGTAFDMMRMTLFGVPAPEDLKNKGSTNNASGITDPSFMDIEDRFPPSEVESEKGQPSFISKQRSNLGTSKNPLPMVDFGDLIPTKYYIANIQGKDPKAVLGSTLIVQFSKAQAVELNKIIGRDFKIPTGFAGSTIEVSDMGSTMINYMSRDADYAANKYIEAEDRDKAIALRAMLKDIASKISKPKDATSINSTINSLSAFIK